MRFVGETKQLIALHTKSYGPAGSGEYRKVGVWGELETGRVTMRYTVPHRWTLVTCSVLLLGLLAWPAPASAQTLSGITTTVLAGTGILAAGTSDTLEASALTGDIPALLTADVLHAATIGYPNRVHSQASLADLALGVAGIIIGADFVMAQASAVLGAAGVGITKINNLWINHVPILVTGAPNQPIRIPGGVVILNEQLTLSDGTIVVNALRITISGVANVVIASAMAGRSGGGAIAVLASH